MRQTQQALMPYPVVGVMMEITFKRLMEPLYFFQAPTKKHAVVQQFSVLG